MSRRSKLLVSVGVVSAITLYYKLVRPFMRELGHEIVDDDYSCIQGPSALAYWNGL